MWSVQTLDTQHTHFVSNTWPRDYCSSTASRDIISLCIYLFFVFEGTLHCFKHRVFHHGDAVVLLHIQRCSTRLFSLVENYSKSIKLWLDNDSLKETFFCLGNRQKHKTKRILRIVFLLLNWMEFSIRKSTK